MFPLCSHRQENRPAPPRAQRRGPRAFKSCILVLLSLGVVATTRAELPESVTPLTLEAALHTAEVRSAVLPGQDAAIHALRELEIAAGRLPDPELGLSLDNVPVNGPESYSLNNDFMTMRSVSLMQTFTGSDKRRARSTRYAREADAATSMRSLQLAQLRTQTARAWFELYYERQMLDFLLRQRDAAQRVVTAVETAYRSGTGGQSDVFAARTAVARIEDRLREIRADVSNAEYRLTRWVGDAAAQPLGEPPKIDRSHLSEANLLTHQVDEHPVLEVLAAQEQVALAEADVARQETSADWNWSVKYSNRGGGYSDMVSVGVSIPLQWDQKNRQDRKLSAKLHQVEQVRAEREEMRREHLFELQQLLSRWRSNLARLDDYEHTLIPLAAQSAQASETAFGSGNASLADALDARRMQIDTAMERLRIEIETSAVWAELEFLMSESASADNVAATPAVLASQGQTP